MSANLSLNFTKDLLSFVIFRKWKYKGVTFFTLLPALILSSISLIEGSFFEIPEGYTGYPLIEDYGAWLAFLFIFTTGMMTYFLFSSIQATFLRLWRRQLIADVSFKEYFTFIKRYERRANSKWVYGPALFFIAVVVINFILGRITTLPRPERIFPFDERVFPISFFMFYAVVVYLASIIGVIFWKFLVLVQCMRNLCQDDKIRLRLQPLNPDRCAGLQPLGLLSYRLSSVLLSFGFYIVTYFIPFHGVNTDPLHIIFGIQLLIMYISLSTFLFFYPLLSAHNIMKDTKNELLDRLSARLGVVYSNFYDELASKGPNIDEQRTKQLLDLRDLYLEAGKMPVWPFDTETIVKFLGTVALPLLLILIQVIIYNVYNINIID